tara:strand:+ start:113 stop:454 length:342 start_codon:yes stop_codon:yes gene_type:complete
MEAFKQWFLGLFSRKDTLEDLILKPEDKHFILELEVAALKATIVQLTEMLEKTNKTVVNLQSNVNKANKRSDLSLKLAEEHEDIFKKIIEEKILVFGLTKKTKIVKPDELEPD